MLPEDVAELGELVGTILEHAEYGFAAGFWVARSAVILPAGQTSPIFSPVPAVPPVPLTR